MFRSRLKSNQVLKVLKNAPIDLINNNDANKLAAETMTADNIFRMSKVLDEKSLASCSFSFQTGLKHVFK